MLFRYFSKFLLVGLVATAVQYVVFALCIHLLNFEVVLSSCLGYITGSIVSYLLNYFFTFQANEKHLWVLSKFYLMVGLGFASNAVLMYVFASQWQWDAWISQVVTTGLVLMQNFGISRFWVFCSGIKTT